MKREVCDLDSVKWKETFEHGKLMQYRAMLTSEIYKSHHKLADPDDVLVIHIARMQDILVTHVWEEVMRLRPCKVEFILDDLPTESALIALLSAACAVQEKLRLLTEQQHVVLQKIEIRQINSRFPQPARLLIDNYALALKKLMLDVVLPKNILIATNGFFAPQSSPRTSPLTSPQESPLTSPQVSPLSSPSSIDASLIPRHH